MRARPTSGAGFITRARTLQFSEHRCNAMAHRTKRLCRAIPAAVARTGLKSRADWNFHRRDETPPADAIDRRTEDRTVMRDSGDGARGTRTPDLLGAIQAVKSVDFGHLAGILGRTRAVHAADKYARFAGDRWSSITPDARSDETRRVASAAQREARGPVWQDPQLPRLPLVLHEPKPGDLAPAVGEEERCTDPRRDTRSDANA
jgi:hypothetical protein